MTFKGKKNILQIFKNGTWLQFVLLNPSSLRLNVKPDWLHCCFLQTNSEALVKEIVGQTSGYMPRDICALIADAGANLFPRNNAKVDKDVHDDVGSSLSSKMAEDNNHGKVSPQITGKEDLLNALERSKKRNASALGTPKVD